MLPIHIPTRAKDQRILPQGPYSRPLPSFSTPNIGAHTPVYLSSTGPSDSQDHLRAPTDRKFPRKPILSRVALSKLLSFSWARKKGGAHKAQEPGCSRPTPVVTLDPACSPPPPVVTSIWPPCANSLHETRKLPFTPARSLEVLPSHPSHPRGGPIMENHSAPSSASAIVKSKPVPRRSTLKNHRSLGTLNQKYRQTEPPLPALPPGLTHPSLITKNSITAPFSDKQKSAAMSSTAAKPMEKTYAIPRKAPPVPLPSDHETTTNISKPTIQKIQNPGNQATPTVTSPSGGRVPCLTISSASPAVVESDHKAQFNKQNADPLSIRRKQSGQGKLTSALGSDASLRPSEARLPKTPCRLPRGSITEEEDAVAGDVDDYDMRPRRVTIKDKVKKQLPSPVPAQAGFGSSYYASDPSKFLGIRLAATGNSSSDPQISARHGLSTPKMSMDQVFANLEVEMGMTADEASRSSVSLPPALSSLPTTPCSILELSSVGEKFPAPPGLSYARRLQASTGTRKNDPIDPRQVRNTPNLAFLSPTPNLSGETAKSIDNSRQAKDHYSYSGSDPIGLAISYGPSHQSVSGQLCSAESVRQKASFGPLGSGISGYNCSSAESEEEERIADKSLESHSTISHSISGLSSASSSTTSSNATTVWSMDQPPRLAESKKLTSPAAQVRSSTCIRAEALYQALISSPFSGEKQRWSTDGEVEGLETSESELSDSDHEFQSVEVKIGARIEYSSQNSLASFCLKNNNRRISERHIGFAL